MLPRGSLTAFFVAGLVFCMATTRSPAQTSCAPPPSGLVGWWRAEGTGRDTVNGNDAALLNGAAYESGAVGQGFSFDGADDRIFASDSPALNFGSNNNFSIEAWIKAFPAESDFGAMPIVDKRWTPDFTRAIGYTLYLDYGRLACQLSPAPGNTYYNFVSSGPNLHDGVFHHVALSVERNSANGARLYVDGQLVHVFDTTIAAGDLSNTEPLRIGNHSDSSLNCYFKGVIDELAIYSRGLSGHEIQGIFAAGSAGKCVSPPTPRQAVERLMTLVESGAPKSQALIATLSAALAAIDRSNPTATINQLQAFQNKVRAQVMPRESELAAIFIHKAQEIIDALIGGSKAHGKITRIWRKADGKTQLSGEAPAGLVYLIEASSNLMDWEKIGVVTDNGFGTFEFEDAKAAPITARFYRIVGPQPQWRE